jgi:hypothetical protein
MADRQSAPAGSQSGARHETARVVLHKSTAPGWFWGLLGFLSVLAVGSAGLLFAAKTGLLGDRRAASAPGVAAASVIAAPAPAPAPAPAAEGSGPQIEPLAAPAPQPTVPVPGAEPKAKVPARPIKLARSPSGHLTAAAAPAVAPAAAASDKPAAPEEAPAAKKPAAEAVPADDGRVHVHHAGASDEDDDDDN